MDVFGSHYLAYYASGHFTKRDVTLPKTGSYSHLRVTLLIVAVMLMDLWLVVM